MTQQCYDKTTLAAFLCGKIASKREMHRVDQHLHHCERCLALLETLLVENDALIESIQTIRIVSQPVEVDQVPSVEICERPVTRRSKN